MKRRGFVAFSGGGAKGVVHVGALKALEQRDVELVGLSGTSAGAIVATLAAAGFRADDLIHPQSGQTIMDELAKIDSSLRRAADLFGPGRWWRIVVFRFVARQPLPPSLFVLTLWLAPALLIGGAIVLGGGTLLIWAVTIWALLGVGLWLSVRSVIGGLADVTRFRSALGALLQRKMFPDDPHRVVTMDDFGREGRPRLKIVSANLSRRSLHLFSAERTPGTAAADAVAASICLPIIFRPYCIDGELHVDGGIVSNLPAWPFDEERELDPEALTIAVEIEDVQSLTTLDRYNWIPSALRTALFGSGELNLRVAGPAEQLALPTRFELLDFDRTAAEAADEVRDVAEAAGVRLDRRLFRLPAIYRDACKVAQALTLDALEVAPGGSGMAPRIRVAVGRLERGYVNSLRLSYSVGYEEDADELMLVPLTGSVAGAAWRDRQSLIESHPLAEERDLPGPENRLRRKARWKSVSWVMCIPISEGGNEEPRLLVQIDGNMALGSSADTIAALDSVEQAVKDFFSLVLHELKELEDGHGA